MKKDEARKNRLRNLNELIMLSAWVQVTCRRFVLFLFVGIRVDAALMPGRSCARHAHPGGLPGHDDSHEFQRPMTGWTVSGGATPRTETL